MTNQQLQNAQIHSVIQRLIQQNYITKDWVEKAPKAFEIVVSTILPQLSTISEFYPEAENIFRAYKECAYSDVKVVLLGQDCYPGDYVMGKENFPQATGLCFDNSFFQNKVSASLKNIFTELSNDSVTRYKVYDDKGNLKDKAGTNNTSRLGHLPPQGVLMINTALTVLPGQAGSHAKLWEPFTNEIISSLNKKDNIVWILLGNYAKRYKSLITNPTHRFIEAVHPSPLSAHRGFFGSKIFSRTNQALKEMGLEQINW